MVRRAQQQSKPKWEVPLRVCCSACTGSSISISLVLRNMDFHLAKVGNGKKRGATLRVGVDEGVMA